MDEIYGTSDFIAPEIELMKKYSNKCDLFSIGITMYYLYFGNFPRDRYRKNLNLNFIIEEDKLLEDLIKKLLIENPDERITWERYFDHDFFKQYEY